MLPYRLSRIFRSRWRALLWSAGVIWTAVSFIGFGHSGTAAQPETALTDDSGATVSNADLAVLANLIGN